MSRTKEQKTSKAIDNIVEDLKDIQRRMSTIDKETCTDKTQRILDEAYDSIDMALRFLNHIDMSEFGTDLRGSHIAIGRNMFNKKKYKDNEQQES